MNKVELIGRSTRDPDCRWTQGEDQSCIARFTLATDRRVRKTEDKNKVTADFIPCTAYGKIAEIIEKHVVQGTKLAVVGRIRTGSYTNRDGQKVYTTDVVVEEMEFVESKKAAAPAAGSTGESGYRDDQGKYHDGYGSYDSEKEEEFMKVPEGAAEEEGLPFK